MAQTFKVRMHPDDFRAFEPAGNTIHESRIPYDVIEAAGGLEGLIFAQVLPDPRVPRGTYRWDPVFDGE